MPLSSFQNLYVDQLNELISCEEKVSSILPSVIAVAASNELQNALDHYLEEVQHHQQFLNQSFEELKVEPTHLDCKPIEGMIDELKVVCGRGGNSPVKDAALIGMVQRIIHFKMAIYGTARSFARHLNYSAMDLLQQALNEETEMDKSLTRLAEGGIFSTGINEAALHAKSYA